MDKRAGELTRAESASYLGYTYKGFSRIVHKIPHRRFRHRLYFMVADLDAFRESQSVEHTPEPAA